MVDNQSSMAIHFSSRDQEQLTPRVIIDAVLRFWPEGIQLDPCAEGTQPGELYTPSLFAVPAERHYTIADDGLMLPWAERNYANPPYSDIRRWVQKAIEEAENGHTTVMLCPARPGSAWWAMLRDCPICLLNGRLTFAGQPNVAPFPSALALIAPSLADVAHFKEALVSLGDIWIRIK